jgi:hypothetical protein
MLTNRRRATQRSNAKLIVLDKPVVVKNFRKNITQRRLAEIEHWQSQKAYADYMLDKRWDEVRRDLAAGALVEPGPIRAWLTHTMVLSGKTKKRTKIRTKMVVR